MQLKRHPFLSRSRQLVARGGWTLVEMSVAIGVGVVILTAVVSAFLTLSRTMVAITNYNELDQSSRNTLDTMNRDLRNTAQVTAFSNSSVTVSNYFTGDLITYAWNGTNSFTRRANGVTTVMLTNCEALYFSGYTRVPTNNFQFVTNDNNPLKTKLITVSWRCSRSILGLKLNTESVQTARICIRN